MRLFRSKKKEEIKELRAEIEALKKDLHPLGAIVQRNDSLAKLQERSLSEAMDLAYSANFQRVPAAQTKSIKSTMDSASCGSSFAAALQVNRPRISEAVINWFGSQGFIGYQLCTILSQHWLISKGCTLPAKDAIRNGYEITINDGTDVDPSFIAQLKKKDEEFKIVENCVELIKMSKIFGVRVCQFVVETDNDTEWYGNPFNIDGVKPGTYRGIAQIDPYWISAENNNTNNPADPDFYVPDYWRVQGLMIHKSHLLVVIPDEVPDTLKSSYFYGGVPLTQKVYERVYAAERTANEAPMLALSKRLNVIKTDMEAVVSDPSAFVQKMNNAAYLRDNHGIRVVSTSDEIEQFDTALADLDSVIMTQYQIVAATFNVPISKLMGTTLKGFGSTGEYEEKNYHEELKSLQENELTKFVQRHHDYVIASCFPEKKGIETKIVWNPLNVPSDTDVAELNKAKSETAVNYVNTGALSGSDVRNNLISDEVSGYNGINDEDSEETEYDNPLENDELSDDERGINEEIKQLMGDG